MLTRASFFQGHEWLTLFGNRDLPQEDRFPKEELNVIIEGNRRVDWPKELLVHLNNGLPAYTAALNEYTDRPENQRLHFLLNKTNTFAEAVAEAQGFVRDQTLEGARLWLTDRTRALTFFGQSNHTFQDSFSHAHAVREPENSQKPWCIRKVKAYAARAPGFDTAEIEYHGGRGEGDRIGHLTSEDSLYREGRDCHEPGTSAEVDACLSEEAQRARLASRDYLASVRRILRSGQTGQDLTDFVDQEMTGFFDAHLALCP